MDVFTLKAKLVMDTSEYDKALTGAKKSTSIFADVLKGNLVSDAITAGVKGVANAVSTISGAVIDVGKSIANLALGGGIERALNTEQATFKLKGLKMETAQVEEVMKNAKQAALDTAYGLDEMATVAASAVAAGVEPGKDLTRTLSLVGDAAAIAGRDIQDMGAIFNKVAASGKIQGDEINQLTNAGIPILELLGKTLGKDTEEVRKLVSAGKIGFAEFQDAIEQGMGGAALKMGQTFSGSLANLQASIKRIGENIMTPVLNEATRAMGELKKIFNAINGDTEVNLQETIAKLTRYTTNMIGSFIQGVDKVLENLFPVLSDVIDGLIPVVRAGVKSAINTISKYAPDLVQTIVKIVSSVGSALVDNIPTITKSLSNVLSVILKAIINAGPTVAKAAKNIIIGLANGLNDNAKNIVEAADTILRSLGIGISESLPMLTKSAVDIIFKLIEVFSENMDLITSIGNALIDGLCMGIEQAVPILIERAPDISKAFWDAYLNYQAGVLESVWNGVVDFFGSLGKGVSNYANENKRTLDNTVKGTNASINSMEKKADEWSRSMNSVSGSVSGSWDKMKDNTSNASKRVSSDVDTMSRNATSKTSNMASSVSGNVSSMANSASKSASSMATSVSQNAANMSSNVSKSAGNMSSNVTNSMNGMHSNATQSIDSLLKDISQKFTNASSNANTWGKDLVSNLSNGLKNSQVLDTLEKTLKSIAQKIKDILGFSEPKEGPLSNFHTYAPDMMKLFAKGVKENEDLVRNQVAKSFDFSNIINNSTYSHPQEYSNAGGTVNGGRGTYTQYITINSPQALDAAESARQIRNATRDMVLALNV